MSDDDIPNLTLRVLQNIQADMSGMRADMNGMRADMNGMRADMNAGFDGVNARVDGVNARVDTLNARFDHFLSFAGRDVQDLKLRVSVVELHLGIKPT